MSGSEKVQRLKKIFIDALDGLDSKIKEQALRIFRHPMKEEKGVLLTSAWNFWAMQLYPLQWHFTFTRILPTRLREILLA